MTPLSALRAAGGWASVTLAIAARPRLWASAVGAAASLVPASWWRRPPFLPVPDRRWVRFRLVTAYGGAGDRRPDVADVVTWLEWRRRFPAA